MGFFSWLSGEIERGKQQVRDESEARQNVEQARENSARYGEEIYDKRMAEASRKYARGDFEGARRAERLADRP